MQRITCYRGNKVALTVETWINQPEFIRQLKKGIIFFDTDIGRGNTEIINLRNFDRVVIEGQQLYGDLINEKI